RGAMGVLLGAIADDFTGATDLCNTLVRRGMRTVQLIDVPAGGSPVPDAEAVVIALKSRTIPADDAVRMSLSALAWLRAAGVLQRQSRGRVGLVQHRTVAQGAAAIGTAFADLRRQGFRHAIVDAIADQDLEAIGEAASDLALITGGSGIALGLPANFRRQGLLGEGSNADTLPPVGGAAAVLSGSCSQATQTQVAYMRERAPAFSIDPLAAA